MFLILKFFGYYNQKKLKLKFKFCNTTICFLIFFLNSKKNFNFNKINFCN